MQSFQELFEDQLRDVYHAEKLILRNLPKLAKKASSQKVSDAFTEHAEQTKGQIERIEEVFSLLGKTPKTKRCVAMEGLIAEADELIEEADKSPIRDAGLIACAQAIEHYEIARYGTLKAWAEKMGQRDIVKLMGATLDEEKRTDEKLTKLAEAEVNVEADEKSKQRGKKTVAHA